MLNVEKFVEGLHDYIGRALNPIIERIAALESRAPEKGEKGDKGDKGDPGLDAQPLSIDDVTPLIEQAVKEFPKPKDGVDGKDGIDGKDGKSITIEDVQPILENAVTKWALEFERRAQDVLQRAIDRIPAPKDGINGKDGRDAFQLEDIQLSLADDDRTVTLAFERDGVRVERSIRLNHPIYRGIWKDGAYEKGDCVTFGGSAFIATRETTSKPETDDSWKLCVKRGRDGRDGQKGDAGPQGPRGPKGETPAELQTAKIR